MPIIHYLNVGVGDCSIIQHISGNVSVIDICNARQEDVLLEGRMASQAALERGVSGNFNQKQYPVNPISYLKKHGIASVFRFVATHPDMDHLDGVRRFFKTFGPTNFWDTSNEEEKEFEEEAKYSEDDWLFYKGLRDTNPQSEPKRLTLYSGAKGQYYNKGEDGREGGDGLHVLAPTRQLVADANSSGDYNDCSYVILYKPSDHRIVFGGDSHDKTWEHILNEHRKDVEGVDVLIAPHHGRASKRSYEFLDILKPKMTFFGNANSEHLAYSAWNYRKLPFITNNQAGCMLVDAEADSMKLYVTNERFARGANWTTFYSKTLQAYYWGEIQ